MLLEDAVDEVLRPGGLLAAELPSYESRPEQLAMARRVAQALDNDERLLVEAGTGTGKTLAYLVPAILSGRKVVVATGTKTLQDQVARLDLPRLQAVLEQPFQFAVMKGLSNYVCLRRFHEHTRQQHLGLGTGSTGEEIDRLAAFIERTRSGDRAELTVVPEEAPIWREVTAAPELRLGKRCEYYERCFVTRMREAASGAQVILANHHLFFADLALKQVWPDAQVLPPYEVVIFDEAHQIEEVATEFFGVQVSSQRLFALARDIGKCTAGPGPAWAAAAARIGSIQRRLVGITETFGDVLRDRLPPPKGGVEEVRVEMPADLWTPGLGDHSPLFRYHELDTVLDEAEALFERLGKTDRGGEAVGLPGLPDPTPAEAAVYQGLSRRAGAARKDLSQLVEPRRRDYLRWVIASPRSFNLRASPIHVAGLLGHAFDAHPGPIVFTSATLTTSGGNFNYVRKRLGLQDAAAEAVFASPFHYEKQALLYLAADLPDPNAEGFATAAAERLLELCEASSGRALLLFTSFRNMRVAEAHFRRDGRFPLLVQGEKPRHALLSDLRARVGSVLLATQSFWEGVDVPGEAVSLVAMDRLPFAVPDDPLTAARLQSIREAGGDPFASYQLPGAALALKQGFGRLIRSRADRGVVAILDGRIARRAYGMTLLGALPRACPRTELIEDVTAFFARAASARRPRA
jgi:ATP-dependent DNA helicase DinG